MTRSELDFLLSKEGRALIEANLLEPPETVALRTRIPALATQVKYLQRARAKLPSWFEARAIVPPLAFEQSSSELAAFSKNISGKTCLDLTCGLGVDAFSFSKNFEKVVTIERDEVLAETVRQNFRLVGVENVEVLAQSAEEFIKHHSTSEPFDWIYLDPARRDGRGRKVFLPSDCEPDLSPLLPVLKKIGRQIMVKYSPMLDVAEAARLFPDAAEIGVLSIGNECKEVWLKWMPTEIPGPRLVVKCWHGGRWLVFEKPVATAEPPQKQSVSMGKTSLFIVEPDVAFYKARMVGDFFNHFFPGLVGELTAPDGFFISQNLVENCPARQFKIIEHLDWQPKKLDAHFSKMGVRRLNVVVRGFPLSAEEARAALRVKEGGDQFLLLSGRRAWLCERAA